MKRYWRTVVAVALPLIAFSTFGVKLLATCDQDCTETTTTCWWSAGNGAFYDEYNPAICADMWSTTAISAAPDNYFAGQTRHGSDFAATCPCNAQAFPGELQAPGVGLQAAWQDTSYHQYCNHCGS